MADDEDDSSAEHPATRNFNRTGFQVRHVVGKALKGAAMGAAIGAAAALAFLLVAGGGFSFGAVIVGSLWPAAGSWLSGMVMGNMLGAAGIGAAIGGLIGGVMADPVGAADEELEKLEARYEQGQARRERSQALATRREQQHLQYEQQAHAMGVRPNLPHRPRQPRAMDQEQQSAV